MDPTQRAIQQAAEESYGRLIAFLARRSRDVSAAEDALSEAFIAAMESWPRIGIPTKPEAWLLTAARRRLIDAARQKRVHIDAAPALLAIAEEAQAILDTGADFPDERLKLLFVCAHPAIDNSVRTPLMLQTVLHMDAARIASAFLVKPSAMGQRLSRAKTKIRDAGIAFEVPESADLTARLNAVLEAIYTAYSSGWDDVTGADHRRIGLAIEAIDLGRLLLRLTPNEPEAFGLLALMLHCEARREARRNATGDYIPLSDQDVSRWSKSMIQEADQLLSAAAQLGRMGHFQLEAAIQSVHARRLRTETTDWGAIALLYQGLIRFAPTIGAHVGRAAAIGEASGPLAGLEALQSIADQSVQSYQPYWAALAHLLSRLGRTTEANTAAGRAVGLCEDESTRRFLAQRYGIAGAVSTPGPAQGI